MPPVPSARIKALNQRPVNPEGGFVLYWMTSARRLGWNFGLQRAVEVANQRGVPLVILEALRCGYPGANDRLHRFVLDGMLDNQRAARKTRALYYPYVEPSLDHGKGLLEAMAAHAVAIVTDVYPAFFLPRMLDAAARRVPVAMEGVDSNGLIPLDSHGKAFAAARFFRLFAQKTLRTHLTAVPDEHPLDALETPALKTLPGAIVKRWPAASMDLLTGGAPALAALPIDHSIGPVAMVGGTTEARRSLTRFVGTNLAGYATQRDHPDHDATSRLSPYLHFGHISSHEIFSAVMTHERWTTRKLHASAHGQREGWWGVSPEAEAFLDQLVIWRELSFNGCAYQPDYTSYGSIPQWARDTLAAHQSDARSHRYSLQQLESARTHDAVWNAAQRQLAAEGWFHGYLRMLWGKKILEWSANGSEALDRMQSLMDRYSLDGRDPNSYAGYGWVLGRYDRPWPERPVFGTVRCMTSDSAKRKLRMKRFLEQYGDGSNTLFP